MYGYQCAFSLMSAFYFVRFGIVAAGGAIFFSAFRPEPFGGL